MRIKRKRHFRFSGTTMLLILFVVIGGLLVVLASDFDPLKLIYGNSSQDEYFDYSEWDEGELPDSIGRYNPERIKFIRENDRRLRQFYGYGSPDIE